VEREGEERRGEGRRGEEEGMMKGGRIGVLDANQHFRPETTEAECTTS
jgi:hypothetical protein